MDVSDDHQVEEVSCAAPQASSSTTPNAIAAPSSKSPAQLDGEGTTLLSSLKDALFLLERGVLSQDCFRSTPSSLGSFDPLPSYILSFEQY
jgi:hypothetical protein